MDTTTKTTEAVASTETIGVSALTAWCSLKEQIKTLTGQAKTFELQATVEALQVGEKTFQYGDWWVQIRDTKVTPKPAKDSDLKKITDEIQAQKSDLAVTNAVEIDQIQVEMKALETRLIKLQSSDEITGLEAQLVKKTKDKTTVVQGLVFKG